MIESKRKREIKQQVHNNVITAILSTINNDEELLFSLLWAQQYISNEILNFQEEFLK